MSDNTESMERLNISELTPKVAGFFWAALSASFHKFTLTNEYPRNFS